MIKADYHIHTLLCNHAKGTMDEYIRSAVKAGLTDICFLDHLTITGKGSYLSMTPGEIPMYVQAVRELEIKYQNSIKIRLGLEVDYNKKHIDQINDIINTFSFDVIAGSVHFVDDLNVVSRSSKKKCDSLDFDFLYEKYLDTVLEMLEYDYYDIICHLDVIKKFGRLTSNKADARIDKKFTQILLKIADKKLTVELNTSGYTHPVNEQYPSSSLLTKCFQKGIPVTTGSDAHKPDEVGRFFNEAASLLKMSGYKKISVFSKRKCHEIPIKNC